jgi:hypothetical protein
MTYAKTASAWAAAQTLPRQESRRPRKTARVMPDPSQKRALADSMAR